MFFYDIIYIVGDNVKRKHLILILIILILISLTIIGFIVNFSKSTSQKIFYKNIDSIYKKIKEEYKFNSNAIEGSIKYSSDKINFIDETKFFDLITGNNYNAEFKVDYSNKIAYLKVNSSYGDNKSTYFKKYYENNKEYTYISDNTENYVSKDLTQKEYDKIFNNISLKESNLILIGALKDAFFDKNNEKFFLQNINSVNKKVGNKKYNLYENILYVSRENSKEFIKNINDNLKSNKEFLKSYKTIYGKEYDISDYKELTDYIYNKELNITLYTKQFGGDFVQMFATLSGNNKVKYFEIHKENNNYIFNTDFFDINISGTLNVGKQQGEINLKLIGYNNGKDTDIKINYSFDYVDKIKKEDISNAVNIRSISSEKYAEIYSNVVDRQELVTVHKIYELYKLNKFPGYISQSMGYIW